MMKVLMQLNFISSNESSSFVRQMNDELSGIQIYLISKLRGNGRARRTFACYIYLWTSIASVVAWTFSVKFYRDNSSGYQRFISVITLSSVNPTDVAFVYDSPYQILYHIPCYVNFQWRVCRCSIYDGSLFRHSDQMDRFIGANPVNDRTFLINSFFPSVILFTKDWFISYHLRATLSCSLCLSPLSLHLPCTLYTCKWESQVHCIDAVTCVVLIDRQQFLRGCRDRATQWAVGALSRKMLIDLHCLTALLWYASPQLNL